MPCYTQKMPLFVVPRGMRHLVVMQNGKTILKAEIMSESTASTFPYLRFARLHGLDYGTVLRAAEWVSNGGSASLVNKAALDNLSMGNAAALAHVIAHEYDRRKAVTDGGS